MGKCVQISLNIKQNQKISGSHFFDFKVSRACLFLSFEDAFQLVVFKSHSDFLPLQLVKALFGILVMSIFSMIELFQMHSITKAFNDPQIGLYKYQ